MSDPFWADVAPDPVPRRLTPITMYIDAEPVFAAAGGALLLLGIATGIVYGLIWALKAPSRPRTVFKTAPVGFLAAASLLLGAPGLLTGGLALSAAGDAFLAVNSRRRLALGLAAFLLAHLAYIGLFLASEFPSDAPGFISPVGAAFIMAVIEPWRGLGILATIVTAVVLGRWLWKDLGGLRWAVAAYIAAIVGMVATAFMLLAPHLIALPGAIAFMASDAILAAQIFKPNTAWAQRGWAKLAVWFLYFGGQVLIAAAFL
jgi:uncharacterized membrane protein YhhN